MKHQVALTITRQIDVQVADESAEGDEEKIQTAVDAEVSKLVKSFEEAGWNVTIDSIELDDEEDEYLDEDDDEDDEEE